MTGQTTGHYGENMKTVQASEAKTHFLSLLDDVERGESIVITRRGKPIARITPEHISSPERFQRARDGMRSLRQRIGTMSVEEIASARTEGRA